jgi:hypothetical protein
VVGAAVLWLVAAALLLGVVRPAERRIRTATSFSEQAAAAGRRLMWAALASDVLFAAALVLMIGQPA